MEVLALALVVALLLKGKGGGGDGPIVVVEPKFPEQPDPEQPDPEQPPIQGPEQPDQPTAPDVPPIAEWEDPYPTPERFYQVQAGDYPLKVAKRALFSAGFLAARDVGGLDEAAANVFAAKVGNNGTRQFRYLDLIQCSPYNDALYGTYGGGGDQRYSGHGRTIRYLRIHPHNRGQLAAEQPPIRNQILGVPADKGKGNRGGLDPAYRQAFPYLWLPPIDLQALWDSDGAVLKTDSLQWDDGSPASLPPPGFVALGIDDASGATETSFGCAGEWEFS